MKKILLFLSVVFIFNFNTHVYASSYLDMIYKGCSKWNDYQKNENIAFADGELVSMMACKSYIIGFLTSGRIDNIILRPETETLSSIGCHKKEEDFDIADRAPIVSRLFTRYLDSNPKEFEETTGYIMMQALQEAYPC